MKIFIDTAPFIYLLENNLKYLTFLRKYFADLYEEQDDVSTSVITFSEYCIKPIMDGDEVLIRSFERFLYKMDIPILNVNKAHAEYAARLRAKYLFLKGMDSLQVGIACVEECDKFLTNDIELKVINEIDILVLENMVKNNRDW